MDFITTPETRAAGAPLCLAVAVSGVLHRSGQIGNVPGTLELGPGGIEAETRQLMGNIDAILALRGLRFRHVFKRHDHVRRDRRVALIQRCLSERL